MKQLDWLFRGLHIHRHHFFPFIVRVCDLLIAFGMYRDFLQL